MMTASKNEEPMVPIHVPIGPDETGTQYVTQAEFQEQQEAARQQALYDQEMSKTHDLRMVSADGYDAYSLVWEPKTEKVNLAARAMHLWKAFTERIIG
jgi:hypothetical protein